MDKVETTSTSRTTADCSAVTLRETSTTRLVFKPEIIDNSSDAEASVKGTFAFERKSKNDEWTPVSAESLATLKMGEGYKLELHTAEVLAFYKALTSFYEIAKQYGVKRGQNEFVMVDSHVAVLKQMKAEDLRNVIQANNAIGPTVLSGLLSWIVGTSDPVTSAKQLLAATDVGLSTLSAAVNLRALEEAVTLWQTNEANGNEEFWQNELTQRSFLLEHIFASPITIVRGKAYVGGKTIENQHGKVVDFLAKNTSTRNATLIEIKTPSASLLGKEYRDGAFVPSVELTGSIVQVLTYKKIFQASVSQVLTQHDDLEVFDPACVIIVGNASELDTSEKRSSFELFRSQLNGVTVVTFDELFKRTEQLLALLEASDSESPVETTHDDCPF